MTATANNTTSRLATLYRALSQGHDMDLAREYAALLQRVGRDEEAYEVLSEALTTERKRARRDREAVTAKVEARAEEIYRELHSGERVCAFCFGRGGKNVHVPSSNAMIDTGFRICEVCRTYEGTCGWGEYTGVQAKPEGAYPTVLKADGAVSRKAREQAYAEHQAELEAARKVEDSIHGELEPLIAARAVNKGALVEYTNKRARARYTDSDERVTTGTRGWVFWAGFRTVGYGYSATTETRLGIETEDGRTFYTNANNCSDEALNAHLRAQGLDRLSLRQKARAEEQARRDAEDAAKALTDEEAIVAVFGSPTPRRGQRCRLDGREGKVAWIGRCKRTGRVRIGIKRLLGQREMDAWGYAAEAAAL